MPVSDQGNLSGRYTLIPRTLIFLTCKDKLLLLKGAPEKRLWANLFNGIGGHLEKGEGLLGSAWRELREETGLESVRLQLCGVLTIDTGEEIGVEVFLLRGEVEETMTIESREGRLEWVRVEELPKLPLVEDLFVLLPQVLAWQNGDLPLSVHSSYDPGGKLDIHFDKPGDH